jgi:hypothetical protein
MKLEIAPCWRTSLKDKSSLSCLGSIGFENGQSERRNSSRTKDQREIKVLKNQWIK